MNENAASVIRRPDKGLTISGSRVTLYALMDYVYADWSYAEIREWLNLTDEQLRAGLDYIEAHRDEVETEYREVLHKADERRRAAEERLRDHLARTPLSPPAPEKAALYAKLAEQRGETIRELLDEETPEPQGVSPS